MPEGDTIFRSAGVLHRALAGHEVTRFESALAPLASARLLGRRVETVAARGKHLLMSFSGDLVLRTHMRMSGSWHLYRPGERWHRPPSLARILIGTAEFEAVAFGVHDAEFTRSRGLPRTAAGQVGPDLLGEAFDAAGASTRAGARPDAAIADVLLDQRVAAGIGNVFKSEILFLAGVHPDTRVGYLPVPTLRGVFELARKALAGNVVRGASATAPSRRRTTGRMAPGESLWVYGRAGHPCRRCGTPIAWRRQGPGARSTFWCPSCQPASPPPDPQPTLPATGVPPCGAPGRATNASGDR
jgi:endonuclease-8